MLYSRWGSTNTEYRGIITLFDGLFLLCLMPTSTPRSLLLSSNSFTHLYLCPAFLGPRCSIQLNFILPNFTSLMTAQCSNLSTSFQRANSTPHCGTVSESASGTVMSCIQISDKLNKARAEPRGTLLVNGCQPDEAIHYNPLSSTLQPALHPTKRNPLIPQLVRLFRRILWRYQHQISY